MIEGKKLQRHKIWIVKHVGLTHFFCSPHALRSTCTLSASSVSLQAWGSLLRKSLYGFVLLFFCFIPYSFAMSDGYENTLTQELTKEEFEDSVISYINNERSFKGLLPLVKDELARNVAYDHANNLVKMQYLSFINQSDQGPDERYTIRGGTGVVTETIKGFENAGNKKIKLTELLIKQLLQAILANPDDSNILFYPYLTNLGVGYAASERNERFTVVLDFAINVANLKPIKTNIYRGEKITVTGNIKKPYKFKAVSIAYYDEFKTSSDTVEETEALYFDNESIKPYLLPQDYIAFGDKSKNNFLNVLKGLGVISAIGAAPFTGGATAILAPPLLSSIQNGAPREIPLKSGFKVAASGDFTGQVDLNYEGMSGLYFVSVIAEAPGINFPLVVSRRTVRVGQPSVAKIK